MESNEKELSYWKSLLLISALFVASTVDGLLHSSLIPMIPLYAEVLGLSEAVSTLLFSIVPCTILLISPILGHYGDKILGLDLMLYTAPILTGAVAAFFGFAKNALSMCIALIGLGIGGALFWSSVYLLLCLYYPKRQALLIGILEVATGVGAALGPPFALFFSAALGFWCPFLLCCGFEILGAAVLYCVVSTSPLSKPSATSPLSSDSASSAASDPNSEAGDLSDLGSDPGSNEPEEEYDDDGDDLKEDEEKEKEEGEETPSPNPFSLRYENQVGENDLTTLKDSPSICESKTSIQTSTLTSSSKLLSSSHSTYDSMSSSAESEEGFPKIEPVQRKFKEKATYVMTNRECLAALSSVFLVQAVYSAIEPHLMQYLQRDLHLKTNLVGMILMITSFGYMAASPLAGKLTESLGSRSVLFTGVGLCGGGLLLLLPFPQIHTIPFISGEQLRLGFSVLGLTLMSASQGMTFVPALPAMLGGVIPKETPEGRELDKMERGVRAKDNQPDTPLGTKEEAAAFLGGVFQSVCHLASALGPVMGQGLLSFLAFGSLEILLGCGLLISAVLLFCQAKSHDVLEAKFEALECMAKEESPDTVVIGNDANSNEADCGCLTSSAPNRRPSSLFGLSPDMEKDSGEQMHEFGSIMVIGKDVDPG